MITEQYRQVLLKSNLVAHAQNEDCIKAVPFCTKYEKSTFAPVHCTKSSILSTTDIPLCSVFSRFFLLFVLNSKTPLAAKLRYAAKINQKSLLNNFYKKFLYHFSINFYYTSYQRIQLFSFFFF